MENDDEKGVYAYKFPDFRCFVNKGITGCGATTLALTDDVDTIVLCPRIQLVKNKGENPQMSHTQMVYGDVKNADIKAYIASHELLKFVSTYEGLARLVKLLGARFRDVRIVVDEAHLVLNDAAFKVYAIKKMLRVLGSHPCVIYLTATPAMDVILNEMEEFRDLPFIEMKWLGAKQVLIRRKLCGKPVDAAATIVKDYMGGKFPQKICDGVKCESSECVIYLNSVNNIINIVKTTGLTSEQCNIICAINKDNEDAVAQLGEGFEIGKVPQKGEPHKMVTLCTSTCFAGVDFFSTNAVSYVISDCHRANTAIDIATELPQICGRQRLESNVFRDEIYFIYNTWQDKKDLAELELVRECKMEKSRLLYAWIENAPEVLKPSVIQLIQDNKARH